MTADRILANLRRPTEHTDDCDGRWRSMPLKHGRARMDWCACAMQATGPSWDEAEEAAEEIEALRTLIALVTEGYDEDDPGWFLGVKRNLIVSTGQLAAVRRALGEDDQ